MKTEKFRLLEQKNYQFRKGNVDSDSHSLVKMFLWRMEIALIKEYLNDGLQYSWTLN